MNRRNLLMGAGVAVVSGLTGGVAAASAPKPKHLLDAAATQTSPSGEWVRLLMTARTTDGKRFGWSILLNKNEQWDEKYIRSAVESLADLMKHYWLQTKRSLPAVSVDLFVSVGQEEFAEFDVATLRLTGRKADNKLWCAAEGRYL